MKKIILAVLLTISSFQLMAQSGESTDLSYGIKLYNDKIYDVAVTQFSSFLEKYSASLSAPQAQFYLAAAYMEMKETDNALKNYQKVILNYPKSEYCEKAIARTGEIYQKQQEFDKAARYYLQLKNYFPTSTLIPEYTLKAAELFYKTRNFDEIKEIVSLLKKKYPNNPFARKAELIQAKVHAAEKDLIIAERIYTDILRTAAEGDVRAACLYDYGRFLLHNNNISAARARFKEIIDKYSKDTNYIPAVIEYCRILTDEKKFDDAAAVLRALKTIPAEFSAEISAIKGENEYFRGNYTTAATEFESSLKIRKNFAVTFQTAYCYAGQGLPEKAASFLLTTLKKDTAGVTEDLKKAAFLKSAEFYIQAGKLVQGVGAYQSYLTAFPEADDADRIAFLMAKAYYDNKRYDEAYDLFQNYLRTVKMSAYDDDAVFLAGESALESGNYPAAVKMYKKVQADYPASRYLPLAQNRINYLETYKLQNSDAVDKLAHLTGKSLESKDKYTIFTDWAKFSFYDLKDYAEAAIYCDKILALNQNADPEINYIYAASLELVTNSSVEQQNKALENYNLILAAVAKNRWTVKALLAKYRILTALAAKGDLSARMALLKQAADSKTDDEHNYLLYEYCKSLIADTDVENGLKYIDLFISTNPASVNRDELVFCKASLLEKKGDFTQALKIYKELAVAKNGSVYKLQALKKLILISNEPVETRLNYFDQIAGSFHYSDDAENIQEQIAAFYAANNNLQKALEIYLALQQKSDNRSLNARWNFQNSNYNKQLGDIFFTQNKFEKAEFYYKRELARTSELNRAEILKKLSTIYKQSGNLAALEYNLKEMSTLTGSATGQEADIALADMEFERENYDKSLVQYAKILANPSFSGRSGIEVKYIQNLYRLKKFAEAEEKLKVFRINYKENYDKNSWEPIFYLEKANYFLESKDYDKATKAYDALISDFKQSDLVPGALYGKGKVLFDTGKKEKAFELWNEVVTKYPNNPISIETNYSLGSIYLEREQPEAAVGALQAVIKYPKEHRLKKYAYKYLIDQYRKAGLTDAAAKTIREYVALYPSEEDVFQKRIEIGNLYQANEEFDQALDYFSRLLNEAKGEDEASVQFYIGETYRLKKDFRQAIKEFLKVKYLIKSDAPQDWGATASYNAALCYEELGEADKAIDLLQEIVDKYGQAHKYGKQAQRVIERVKGN